MWGWTTKKVGVPIKHIRYGHFFKGVFSENILYTFQDFGHFQKGVIWAKFRLEFEKLDSQKVYPGTKIKRIYITWVCRRGLDGSRTLEVHYLARSDHSFNFLGYLENITTHLHFRDFDHSPKGCLSEIPDGNLNNDFLVTTFQKRYQEMSTY